LASCSSPFPPGPLSPLRLPRPRPLPMRGELGVRPPSWKDGVRPMGNEPVLPPLTKCAANGFAIPDCGGRDAWLDCWNRCSEVVPTGSVRPVGGTKLPIAGRPREEGWRAPMGRAEGGRESDESPTVSLNVWSQSVDGFSLKTGWNCNRNSLSYCRPFLAPMFKAGLGDLKPSG